jgi:hypothetical protein
MLQRHCGHQVYETVKRYSLIEGFETELHMIESSA